MLQKAPMTSKTCPSWSRVWVDRGLALLRILRNQRGSQQDPPLWAWRTRQASTKGGPPRASALGFVPHEGSYQAGPRVLGHWRILWGFPAKNQRKMGLGFHPGHCRAHWLGGEYLYYCVYWYLFIYLFFTRGQRVLDVITSIVATTFIISRYIPLLIISVTLISPHLRST